jgi:hypothetical protein
MALDLTTFDLGSTVAWGYGVSILSSLIIKFSTLLPDTRTCLQIYPYVINSLLTLPFLGLPFQYRLEQFMNSTCVRERERPRALVFSKARALVPCLCSCSFIDKFWIREQRQNFLEDKRLPWTCCRQFAESSPATASDSLFISSRCGV